MADTTKQYYVTMIQNGITYAIEHVWPNDEIEWGELNVYNSIAQFTFEDACKLVDIWTESSDQVQIKEYPVEGIVLP